MLPHGPITSVVPGGVGNLQWETITAFDPYIHPVADPLGWSVEHIRATIVIESRGVATAHQVNASNGDSYGLMQVVPFGVGWDGWYKLVAKKAGLSGTVKRQQIIDALYDPAINIACGVEILEGFYKQYGDADKAASAFFLGNPDWRGGDSANGTSGADYRKALNALKVEQKGFAPADPIRIIVGGDYPPIDYGWLADAGLTYYAYGVGHGTQRSTQHPGVDVGVPHGTRLYCPVAGVVDCVGSKGNPRWGQGCGAYNDVMYGGIGNITILLDSGHKLTLGHCHTAVVQVGQRVTAGQQVGTSGGMNGDHVHVEISVLRNGTYWLLEPIAALQEAMGVQPGPPVPLYVDPAPVPQPEEFEVWHEVTCLRDNTLVLSRANLDAPQSKPPLKKGDTFNAVYQVTGNDKRIYWITTLRSRVLVEGTACPTWPGTVAPCPPAPHFGLSESEYNDVTSQLDAAHNAIEALTFDLLPQPKK